jgi:hypothetical protein
MTPTPQAITFQSPATRRLGQATGTQFGEAEIIHFRVIVSADHDHLILGLGSLSFLSKKKAEAASRKSLYAIAHRGIIFP